MLSDADGGQFALHERSQLRLHEAVSHSVDIPPVKRTSTVHVSWGFGACPLRIVRSDFSSQFLGQSQVVVLIDFVRFQ